MGYYINPPNCSKEDWLAAHGTLVDPKAPVPADHHLVCLVDNGAFTAAGIAYDERELADFSRNDGRAKLFLAVPDEKLREVAPGVPLA